jgi:hypothetical protein
MDARPGMWDQLSNRTTASQRMLHSRQRQRLSWQRQRLNRQRKRRQRRQPARPEEESYQQPEQELRSCCRRHSARMQRRKRLKQVWSSSIDTPEILRIKFLGRAFYWAFTQMSAEILEGFASISYLFRETCSAFNGLQSRSGLKVYRCNGLWRILWVYGGRPEEM